MTVNFSSSEPSSLPPSDWKETTKISIFGELKRNKAQSFVLLFERLPLWFLSLLPHEVDKIYLPSLTTFIASFGLSGPLEHLFRDHYFLLKGRIVEYVSLSSLPSSLIYLYSGSLNFITSFTACILKLPSLGIVDSFFKIRQKFPTSAFKWSSISHAYIGGATNFQTLWFSTNLPSFEISIGMKRNIDHFILHHHRGHSLPPSPTNKSTTQGLLRLGHVLDKYVFATHSSRSGFATRSLVSQELSDIFGYGHLENFTGSFIHSSAPVPRDLIRSLLQPALQTLGSSSIVRPSLEPVVSFIPSDPLASATFLPSLGRSISNEWCLDKHHDCSAKNDDAAANISFWNKRISGAHTHIPASQMNAAISILRCAMLRYATRKLFREFLGFIEVHFGDSFTQYFQARCQHYSVVLEGFKKGFPVYVKAKALRATRGGTDFVFTTRSPDFERFSSYFYRTLTPPYSMLSADLPFYKVLHAGRRILHSYAEPYACEDAYMSWNAGSTLIFWRWAVELQRPALLGWDPMILEKLPQFQGRPQRLDKETRMKVFFFFL